MTKVWVFTVLALSLGLSISGLAMWSSVAGPCVDKVVLVSTHNTNTNVSCRKDQVLLIPSVEASDGTVAWLVGCACLKQDRPNPSPTKMKPKVDKQFQEEAWFRYGKQI